MTATKTERPGLSLLTVSGAPLLARRVVWGERFGPFERNVYGSREPAIEFLVPHVRGARHLAAYRLDVFAEIADAGFSPGGDAARRLPGTEVRRLLDWIE